MLCLPQMGANQHESKSSYQNTFIFSNLWPPYPPRVNMPYPGVNMQLWQAPLLMSNIFYCCHWTFPTTGIQFLDIALALASMEGGTPHWRPIALSCGPQNSGTELATKPWYCTVWMAAALTLPNTSQLTMSGRKYKFLSQDKYHLSPLLLHHHLATNLICKHTGTCGAIWLHNLLPDDNHSYAGNS